MVVEPRKSTHKHERYGVTSGLTGSRLFLILEGRVRRQNVRLDVSSASPGIFRRRSGRAGKFRPLVEIFELRRKKKRQCGRGFSS